MAGIFFYGYYDLLDAKRKKIEYNYDPALSACDYENWNKEELDDSTVKTDEEEFYDLPPLEGDKKAKEGKGLKISIYYCTCKDTRQQYKLKIIAPTWNDELELPDGSYSVSEYLVHHRKTQNITKLSTNSPIHFYISRINNRLVFIIKDGYKLQLPQTSN